MTVALWLKHGGLQVIFTGSNDAGERAALEQLVTALPVGVRNFAGFFTLSEVACLLSRARLYVGPDTVITHMSGALGIPTIALFGPSDPVKWGSMASRLLRGLFPVSDEGITALR